jgi:septum formation protein
VKLTAAAPLVLGSASPRRREILASVGVPHVVVVAAADETVRPGEPAEVYLERVVGAKLDAVREAVAGGTPGDLAATSPAVLVADTIVLAEGSILGKPRETEDALRMIEQLSGRTHEVRTRFLLAPPASGSPALFAETVTTQVTFRTLSVDELRAYTASGEGLDKAGAYAVQGLAAAFVSRIDGSYTNVVGLPACEVVVALARLGLR